MRQCRPARDTHSPDRQSKTLWRYTQAKSWFATCKNTIIKIVSQSLFVVASSFPASVFCLAASFALQIVNTIWPANLLRTSVSMTPGENTTTHASSTQSPFKLIDCQSPRFLTFLPLQIRSECRSRPRCRRTKTGHAFRGCASPPRGKNRHQAQAPPRSWDCQRPAKAASFRQRE